MYSIGTQFLNILQSHIDVMSNPLELFAAEKFPCIVPYVPKKLLLELLGSANIAFLNDPLLLDLEGNIVVVGDLHGHILDLYNIIKSFGLPPSRKYLFLGDIVDRGSFSVECITLVLVLKVLYPNNVYVIRGNHEFENDTAPNLMHQCFDLYRNSDVYHAFLTTFAYMPIAAKIGPCFCVHGGLDPHIGRLEQINQFKRPLYKSPEELDGLFWSDPNPSLKVNFTHSHLRNRGYEFNENALTHFLEANQLSLLVRGHQFVNGYDIQMNGKVITIFSASNYIEGEHNSSCALYIGPNYKPVVRNLNPLKPPPNIVPKIPYTSRRYTHDSISKKRPRKLVPISNSSKKLSKSALNQSAKSVQKTFVESIVI